MNTGTLECNKTKDVTVKNWLIYVILLALDVVLGIFSITYFIHNFSANDNGLSYLLYLCIPMAIFFGLVLGLATSSEDESVTVKIPENIYKAVIATFYFLVFGVIAFTILFMFIVFLLMLGSMAGD